jgi:hypothetical protein
MPKSSTPQPSTPQPSTLNPAATSPVAAPNLHHALWGAQGPWGPTALSHAPCPVLSLWARARNREVACRVCNPRDTHKCTSTLPCCMATTFSITPAQLKKKRPERRRARVRRSSGGRCSRGRSAAGASAGARAPEQRRAPLRGAVGGRSGGRRTCAGSEAGTAAAGGWRPEGRQARVRRSSGGRSPHKCKTTAAKRRAPLRRAFGGWTSDNPTSFNPHRSPCGAAVVYRLSAVCVICADVLSGKHVWGPQDGRGGSKQTRAPHIKHESRRLVVAWGARILPR